MNNSNTDFYSSSKGKLHTIEAFEQMDLEIK